MNFHMTAAIPGNGFKYKFLVKINSYRRELITHPGFLLVSFDMRGKNSLQDPFFLLLIIGLSYESSKEQLLLSQ